MFLRSVHRKKDGKDHRYFSIVENRRVGAKKIVQRTVLYLGEINDQQQAAWRKTLPVFDEEQQDYTELSPFPDDREIPADAIDSLQVKLSGLQLKQPRVFGYIKLAIKLGLTCLSTHDKPLAINGLPRRDFTSLTVLCLLVNQKIGAANERELIWSE